MNLPDSFVNRTMVLLGDEYPALEEALKMPVPTSVRVNDKTDFRPSDDVVPWCKDGYYLQERPLFTADPLLHAGAYYVQEASSMFLSQAVEQYLSSAERVLDLCAAPGGKSTLLLQTLPDDCLLVSNEIIRSRANILYENVVKWGNANVIVTNNEPSAFRKLSGYFDAIVIDAPCSGEGMFRKDPNAINEWSLQQVAVCAKRQRDILASVWDALKPNGILIYSTCTFNKEENEENAAWICGELGATVLSVDLKGNNNITTTDYGYRFYPHKTRGEGFFLSVMRKNETDESCQNFRIKSAKIKEIKSLNVSLTLSDKKDWIYAASENEIKAYLRNFVDDFCFFEQSFNCLCSGIVLGEMKAKNFIPSHQIALSKELDKKDIETVELDYKRAISYLKNETIYLPEIEKTGMLLVCYKNVPLGWVKNVGNRCNNLYPSAWRIRMNL